MASRDLDLATHSIRNWVSIVAVISGSVWGVSTYLNRFANASDMGKLNEKVDALSRVTEVQDLRFKYIEKDLDFLKDQTIELGKATGARLLKKPQRGY